MRGPDKQFDRDKVLDRAMELFWSQGFTATGMSQLLDHMEIGRQSLYDTFGDKKSLYLQALDRYFEQQLKSSKATLERPGSPLSNLRELLHQMVQMIEGSGFNGCFIGNSLAEFGHRDEEVQRLLGRCLGRFEQALVQLLRRAAEAGELSPEASPENLARMIVVTGQGAALLSKIQPDRREADKIMETAMALIEKS